MLNTEPLPSREITRRDVDKPGWKGSRVKWSTPTLRTAKIIFWLEAKRRIGEDAQVIAAASRWAKFGVTGYNLAAAAQFLMPWFGEHALERLGHDAEVLPSKCRDRLHKMYHRLETQKEAKEAGRRKNAAGNYTPKWVPSISVEHPIRSRPLQIYEMIAREVYMPGKPITQEYLNELVKAEEAEIKRRLG